MASKNPTKVITGPRTKMSYLHVLEPASINGSNPKYSVSLIIPKSDKQTLDAINAAVECGFTEVLLVGHIGKLVKLGIGQTNTHSSAGDGRMETLTACALLCGADLDTLHRVVDCVTTDAALEILQEKGLKDTVCTLLGKRIQATLERRVPPGIEIGYVLFTNREDLGGLLHQSDNAERLMENWRRNV